jgi:general secretion pathway protein B
VPLQALPPEIRQRVPTLKLSGSILSPRRADRLLIVDGQVAHEGDAVAPGVVLEQILPRSAVFRFQQHRFEVPY